MAPEPLNDVAVITPVVLILDSVPIPPIDLLSLSTNSILPPDDFLSLTLSSPVPISISSTPVIVFAFGSRVIDPVPIVSIPVILASPVTTRSSV